MDFIKYYNSHRDGYEKCSNKQIADYLYQWCDGYYKGDYKPSTTINRVGVLLSTAKDRGIKLHIKNNHMPIIKLAEDILSETIHEYPTLVLEASDHKIDVMRDLKGADNNLEQLDKFAFYNKLLMPPKEPPKQTKPIAIEEAKVAPIEESIKLPHAPKPRRKRKNKDAISTEAIFVEADKMDKLLDEVLQEPMSKMSLSECDEIVMEDMDRTMD